FDVASDVADFGELRRLDLDERRARELRQATRDFGFADAGGTDENDVVRTDLLANRLGSTLTAPAIAQRNRHRLLRVSLSHDIAIELGDDLLWRQVGESGEGLFGAVRRHGVGVPSRLQDVDVRIRIHADLAGDSQTAIDDLFWIELGVRDQCTRRRESVGAARADSQHAVVRLDQFAGPRDHESMVSIDDDEQSFQAAEHTVAAPVLRQLDGGAGHVFRIALELLLEL